MTEPSARIVDAIYEAAFDEGLWNSVVHQVAASTGGFGGSLVLFDTTRSYLPVQYDHGFQDGMWNDYGAHYIKIDPRIPSWLAKPQLETYTDGVLGITPQMRRTMEYFDWENRGSDQRFGYGARLFVANGVESSLFLGRSDKQGAASDEDIGKLVQFLPHLRRSITLSRRIGQRISTAALDALSFGILVLDETGRVSFANGRIQAMAAEQDGLRLSAAGLTLAEPTENAAYQRTVEKFRRRNFFDGAPMRTALPASRPSGKRPYSILICPFQRLAGLLPDFRQSLLICVSDPAQTLHLNEEVLAALFELTAAEARLTISLVQRGSLSAAAADCGLTDGSARQYLKRIYGKTGTRGQVDLVALILGSVRS